MLTELARVDEWLDDAVSQEYKDQPLAQDWARISKIGEELGEAIDAFILYTGQNPRKQSTELLDDTLLELADVVMTGILAMLHLTKDQAAVGNILLTKMRSIARRVAEHKIKANK